MRVGSLFSGVEGMGLGVTAALGCEVVWHAEMDPWASVVLERHFGVPNHGDVTKIDWSKVEPVDGLIGGPPCQAVSSAGRRLGTADPRWMWPEALRAMRELKPRWCLWENPAALLTGKDPDEEDEDDAPGGDPGPGGLGEPATDPRWFSWILGEVAALGFDARWTCVRSSDVGGCHKRDRVFLAAALADGERAWRDGGGLPGEARVGGRKVVDVHAALDGGAGASVALLPSPRTTDGTGPAVHGDGGLDLSTAVALLPTPRATGRRAARDDGSSYRADGYDRTDLRDAVQPERWGKYAAAVARWERCFGEPAPGPRDDKGRLHVDLPRWMMGFPRGWLDDIPRTAALKCAGNSCQPQSAALAASQLLSDPPYDAPVPPEGG